MFLSKIHIQRYDYQPEEPGGPEKLSERPGRPDQNESTVDVSHRTEADVDPTNTSRMTFNF